VGFGQITGEWSADICLTGIIESDLTLCYNVSGLDICSVSGFDGTGWATQGFTLGGGFGPFTVAGSMTFSPATVTYTKSDVTTKFDFAGITLGLKVEHFAAGTALKGCAQTPEEGSLRYTLTGTVAPITLKLTFIDCCTGTEFYSLLATAQMPICCGIVLDAAFSFTKAGFDYLSFSGIRVPICCGIYVDLGVKFTTTAKALSVTPKFAGFGEACFEVYGDVVGSGMYLWEGIRVDGFKIQCTLAECNYVEFVTTFNPDLFYTSATAPWSNLVYNPTSTVGLQKFFDTVCGEFEYIGLGFCGAGCCGGQYNGAIKIYFGTGGGLFDVTRIGAEFSLPLMESFALDITTNIAAAACAGASTTCFGFTFTF